MPGITLDDLIGQCCRLEPLCFESDLVYGEEKICQLLGTKHFRIRYRVNKENSIIGYIIYRDDYHVVSLCVLPWCRGEGIGKALMNIVLDQAFAESASVTLECRPYNEPFYRRLGFKPVCLPKDKENNDDYYHHDYYRYDGLKVHGIFMRRSKSFKTTDNATVIKKVEPTDRDYESYRAQLLDFATQVKTATSVFYGGWLANLLRRTQRKEKAFTAIINELTALGNAATKHRAIDVGAVLQGILFNATVVRGLGLFSRKTHSGQAAVKLLNSAAFKDLRELISGSADGQQNIDYASVRLFAKTPAKLKSGATPAPYSPYRHF